MEYTSVQVSYLWFLGGCHICSRASGLTSIMAQEVTPYDHIDYPPEDPDDYRMNMDDDHDLVADIDCDTFIRIVKFLKRGKVPGPDNIHNEVLRLGTTTSLFHQLARLLPSPYK